MLSFKPIMVDDYAAFLNCMPVGRASNLDGLDLMLFILVGWDRSFLSVAWLNWRFSFAPDFR